MTGARALKLNLSPPSSPCGQLLRTQAVRHAPTARIAGRQTVHCGMPRRAQQLAQHQLRNGYDCSALLHGYSAPKTSPDEAPPLKREHTHSGHRPSEATSGTAIGRMVPSPNTRPPTHVNPRPIKSQVCRMNNQLADSGNKNQPNHRAKCVQECASAPALHGRRA